MPEKTREPLHRFAPEVGCAQRSCIHWENCVAAMPERGTHPTPYFADHELFQDCGPDQVGGTGGAKSGPAEVLCFSYECKREPEPGQPIGRGEGGK